MLTDLKKTAKHTSVYALGNIAIKLIGVILIPLYTNAEYLTHEEFGVLTVLEATLQLLLGLLTFAMISSLTRWYWDDKYKNIQNSIFFTTILFLVVVLIPTIAGLMLFANPLSNLLFKDVDYSYLLRLTFATAGIQIINNQILCLVRLQSLSKKYVFIQVFKITLVLLLILYWILLKHQGLEAIWKANLIAEIIILIILFPYLLRNIELKFQFKIFNEMIRYGFPLMLASVSGVMLAVTDRYMLSSLSGLEETGVYSVGFRIANVLKLVISTSLLFSIAPLRMKKMNEPNNQRFYSKVFTYSGYIFIIGALGISLFSLEGIKIFTSSPLYWKSNGIVPIIAMALFFGLLKDNITVGLSIKKATGVIGIFIFITGVLNIVLNILLIPVLDIYGAALSTLLSQLFLFVMLLRSAQKAYLIPYELKKMVLLFAVASLFIFVGIKIENLDVLLRISIKLVMFLSFPFILHLFRFYEPIEIETIKRIIKHWYKPGSLKENINRLLRL
ncbi:oligosaccharide flippase family protein [Saccharicrinis sp. FJH2]|uniref:oligosaccharide flippase family protein n=1 Tax=Saccharicrinis sp. FJH65 TaxID=3344659 RepID=UPI0035F42460